MKKVCKRAGLPRVSTNDFRRTFATWCADYGVDESVCCNWMGHTSNAMVRRVYQQLSEKRSAGQAARLEAGSRAADDAVEAARTAEVAPVIKLR